MPWLLHNLFSVLATCPQLCPLGGASPGSYFWGTGRGPWVLTGQLGKTHGYVPALFCPFQAGSFLPKSRLPSSFWKCKSRVPESSPDFWPFSLGWDQCACSLCSSPRWLYGSRPSAVSRLCVALSHLLPPTVSLNHLCLGRVTSPTRDTHCVPGPGLSTVQELTHGLSNNPL